MFDWNIDILNSLSGPSISPTYCVLVKIRVYACILGREAKMSKLCIERYILE